MKTIILGPGPALELKRGSPLDAPRVDWQSGRLTTSTKAIFVGIRSLGNKTCIVGKVGNKFFAEKYQ